MEFEELTHLISIRNYVINTINNSAIDRAAVNELSGILILVDRKIIGILRGEGFKEYIGYQGAKQAIEEVARLNNIKSGLKR